MSVAAPISLEQYFDNPTKPASEYICGELFPKAMPTNLHSALQAWITFLLFQALTDGRHRIRTEQNVRLSDHVILIPDICVLREPSKEPGFALTEPPLLCVEILSPSDRFADTEKKCRDYLRWGVDSCWILNPESQEAWLVSTNGFTLIPEGGSLSAATLSLPLAKIFPPDSL